MYLIVRTLCDWEREREYKLHFIRQFGTQMDSTFLFFHFLQEIARCLIEMKSRVKYVYPLSRVCTQYTVTMMMMMILANIFFSTSVDIIHYFAFEYFVQFMLVPRFYNEIATFYH